MSIDKKEKWTLYSCSYVTNYIFSFNNYVALNTFLKLCLKSFSIFSDLLTQILMQNLKNNLTTQIGMA